MFWVLRCCRSRHPLATAFDLSNILKLIKFENNASHVIAIGSFRYKTFTPWTKQLYIFDLQFQYNQYIAHCMWLCLNNWLSRVIKWKKIKCIYFIFHNLNQGVLLLHVSSFLFQRLKTILEFSRTFWFWFCDLYSLILKWLFYLDVILYTVYVICYIFQRYYYYIANGISDGDIVDQDPYLIDRILRERLLMEKYCTVFDTRKLISSLKKEVAEDHKFSLRKAIGMIHFKTLEKT